MRTVRAWLTTIVCAGGACWIAGCTPASGSLPAPIGVGAGLQAEYVAVSDTPIAALACTADGRVFYTEKETGRIRLVREEQLMDEPVATVPVNYAGDRGLLGIALHPRFEDNGRIYVFYSRSDTGESTDDPQAIVDHRIVYFEVVGDIAPAGEIFVASLPVGSGTTRIGGRIAFAPDRSLYVGFGDTTDAGAAQAADQLFGKILRYAADGSIPSDNPTADSAVFARGLSDPRGLAFDPTSGVLFVTDRSGDGPDEIDRILAGKNYGWPAVAGRAETDDELAFAAQEPDYVDPLAESDRGLTGATFNPSGKYGPDSVGSYCYGVASAARVEQLRLSPTRDAVGNIVTLASGFPAELTDVVFTPAGTLFVASERALLVVVPLTTPRLAPEE